MVPGYISMCENGFRSQAWAIDLDAGETLRSISAEESRKKKRVREATEIPCLKYPWLRSGKASESGRPG